jgi:hypothetical protein
MAALLSMAHEASEQDKCDEPQNSEELATFIFWHVGRCRDSNCDLCFMVTSAADMPPYERCDVPHCVTCRIQPVISFMDEVAEDEPDDMALAHN